MRLRRERLGELAGRTPRGMDSLHGAARTRRQSPLGLQRKEQGSESPVGKTRVAVTAHSGETPLVHRPADQDGTPLRRHRQRLQRRPPPQLHPLRIPLHPNRHPNLPLKILKPVCSIVWGIGILQKE